MRKLHLERGVRERHAPCGRRTRAATKMELLSGVAMVLLCWHA